MRGSEGYEYDADDYEDYNDAYDEYDDSFSRPPAKKPASKAQPVKKAPVATEKPKPVAKKATPKASSGSQSQAPEEMRASAAEKELASVSLSETSTATVQNSRTMPAGTSAPQAGTSSTRHSAPAEAAAAPALVPASSTNRRPLSEYKLPPDLAAVCDQIVAREREGGKSQLHLAVLGHVDAGKSTLMGRLLHELGVVDAKEVQRSQREAAQAGKASFSWAWLLDERREERARGVTVDVATCYFDTPRRHVVVLDAPGHRDFVPNMIMGAAQADAALLIVDGSPDGFERGFDPGASVALGGQTQEHAQLARSLGVDQLAVVVSKLDTCNFSQERFQQIKAKLLPALRRCGFAEADIQWLPAAAPSATNLVHPPTEPALKSWWQGPTVVEAIDAFRPPERNIAKPLRMPIISAFKRPRGGLAVVGRLVAGALAPGTRVTFMPSRESAVVKEVKRGLEEAAGACAADSAEVALSISEAAQLRQGDVMCHPDWPVRLAARLEVRIIVLELDVPILLGQQATLHLHACQESAVITRLVSVLNVRTGQVTSARPRCLLSGQTAVVEVTAARPVCVELYSEFRALGRLALRDGGSTLAVGVVTKVYDEEG